MRGNEHWYQCEQDVTMGDIYHFRHCGNNMIAINNHNTFILWLPNRLLVVIKRSSFLQTTFILIIFQPIFVTTACQWTWPRRCSLWSFSKFGWPPSITVDIPGCGKYQSATPSHTEKYTKDITWNRIRVAYGIDFFNHSSAMGIWKTHRRLSPE